MASREVVSLLHPPQRSPHHSGGISTKWVWSLNYDSGRSYQPLPPSSAPSGRTIEVIGAFPSLVHLHKAWSSYQSWIDVNQDVRSQEFCDLQQKLDQQVAALASSPLKDKSKSKFPLPSTTEATLPQPPLHPMINKLLPSGEKKQPHDLSEFRATAMVGSHIHEGERNLEGLPPSNNREAEWKRRGSLITSQQRSPEGAGNDAAVVLGDNDYGSRFTTIEDKKRLYQQQQRISSKHYTPTTTTIYPTPTPTTIVATATTATTPSRIPPSHEKQQNYHYTNFKQNHAGSTRRRENSYNLQSGGGGGGGIYCGNLYSQHPQHLGQQQRHQEWHQQDFASKPNQQSIRRGRPSPPPPPPPQSRFHHHAVQFQQNNAQQIAPVINNRRDRSTISIGNNSNWFRHGNPERNPREETKGPSLVDVEGKYQAMRQDGTRYNFIRPIA
eukprot:jgi/Bigna1/74768/fgenesh1_pg.30_\